MQDGEEMLGKHCLQAYLLYAFDHPHKPLPSFALTVFFNGDTLTKGVWRPRELPKSEDASYMIPSLPSPTGNLSPKGRLHHGRLFTALWSLCKGHGQS